MATTISTQDIVDAKRDIDDIGEAVNEVKIVSPRYGDDFKSLPMLAAEAQDTISEWQDAVNTIVLNDGVPALAVSDASGKSQQQINNALTNGYAYIEFFGDTVVDATDAINACLLHCKTYNKTAKSIPNKVYPVLGKVSVFTNCDFSQSTFSFPNTYNSVAVEIKPQVGDGGLLRGITVKLPNLTCNKVGGVAPVAGSVGIKLEAVRDTSVYYSDIQGFENNILLFSNSGSKYVSYVNFYGDTGVVLGSKVNLHMLVEADGWVNECKFFGGHWGENSVDRAAYDAINLKFTKSISGGNNGPNGHCFFGVSMEGAFSRTIDYDYPPDLSTSYNSNNLFFNCRLEQAKEIRYNKYSLADTFIGCSGILGVNWVDGNKPNIIAAQGIFNHYISVAATPGSTGFRAANNTHVFSVGNSSNALALATVFSGAINGGLLANGSYVLFHPSDLAREHPVVKISRDFSAAGIAMGDGTAAPTSRLTYYTDTQWRHNFDFCPDTNGGRNLGAGSQRYNNVFALKGNFSEGIGVFGTAPPTSKRSITGKKSPANIAEQNAVLDSIVSALVAYGLVSDDRTV